MGGILSGLMGGLAEGTAKGWEAEAQRQQKESDLQRDIMGKFHMSQLAKWEDLTPAQQQFHAGALEELYAPHAKKGTFQTGTNLIKALHDAYASSMPKGLSLPPETLQAMGIEDPSQMTLNQARAAQAEQLGALKNKQAMAEKAAAEEEQYKKSRAAAAELGASDTQIRRGELKKRYNIDLEAVPGSFSQPVEYENINEPIDPKTGKRPSHYISHNGKTDTMYDHSTGQDLGRSLSGDFRPVAKPRDIPDQMIRERTGEVSLVNRKEGTSRKVQGVKGPIQYPPTKTVTDLDENGNPIQRVLTTPEAVRESKAGGGFAHPATADITKSTQGQRVLQATARIRKLTNDLQARIGPFAGRWTEAQIKGGDLPGADPETARLVGELDMAHSSLAAMLPKLHDFRSQKAAQDFLKVGPGWHKTPDLNMGNIDSIENLAKSFSLKDQYKKGGLSQPPTTGATPRVRKYNPTTGQLE